MSQSHAGSVVYCTVEDIPETLRRINANGGKTFMPKTSIGEHGFVAHYKDTEGNKLALLFNEVKHSSPSPEKFM